MAAASAQPLSVDTSPPQSTLSRWTPSLPTSLMGMLNPFGSSPDSPKDDAASAPSKSNAISSVHFDPRPPSPSKSLSSVMFAEPDSRSNSDLDSHEGSEYNLKRARKSSKPKTCYSMCHPPPAVSSARQKLHRRPRSLLQLHKLSPGSRPVPAFDVIPSVNYSVKLQRAVAKIFKAKHGLCPNDLVVLRAEKYNIAPDEEDEEGRDVIGLICKGKKEDRDTGKHKISLASGMEWEAYALPNGAYEFFATDEHGLGLTVRWVPKKVKDGSKPREKKRFNFSTITPNSRRHPVIASLSQTALDINDSYKMPDQTGSTPNATPRQSSILAEAMMADGQTPSEENLLQDIKETDGLLREIITMTSIWVTFKEGWSPSFRAYEDKESLKSITVPGSPVRRGSTDTPPGSPAVIASDRRSGSIKSNATNFLRKGSLRLKGNRDSVTTVPPVLEEPEPVSLSAGRTRADSTSTVLVHRAASNRRKNHQATLSVQQPLSETSHESPSGDTPKFIKRASWQAASPDMSATPRKDTFPESPLAKKTMRDVSPDKRESTATTETSDSSKRSSKQRRNPNSDSPRRKSSGWRRLLCGKT